MMELTTPIRMLPMMDICWWTRHLWGLSLALVVLSFHVLSELHKLEIARALVSSVFLVSSSWIISDVTLLVENSIMFARGARSEAPCSHALKPELALASGFVTICLYAASILLNNPLSTDVMSLLLLVGFVLFFLLLAVAFAVVQIRKRLGAPDKLTIEELVGQFDGVACKCEICRGLNGTYSLQFPE
jgi:hypothetical protein